MELHSTTIGNENVQTTRQTEETAQDVDQLSNTIEKKKEDNNIEQKSFVLTLANNYLKSDQNEFIMKQLRKTIPRLAEELYDEDIHFLLELIQNADDNSYDNNIIPTLHFNLFDDKIIIGNNEIGFSKENIEAICSISSSTKVGDTRKGFIGKKGIGFKSVFKVSSTPEVHSNGYHISFDVTNNNQIGYVCPNWLEEIDENVSQLQNNNTTVIKLPFKTDKTRSERRRVKKDIKDLDITILLFLNKLRRIIINHDNDEKRIITRNDYENGKIVEIIETIGTVTNKTRWFKVEETFEIPETLRKRSESQEEKDVQTHTCISVVFPLEKIDSDNQIWDIKDVSSECCNFPVFAYLPTKYTPNFNFIIQADFNLQSSREYMHKEDKMNQWIREQLPDLFYTAIQQIQEHPRDGSWVQSLNNNKSINSIYSTFFTKKAIFIRITSRNW